MVWGVTVQKRRAAALLLAMAWVLARPAAAEPLRFAVGQTWAPPLAQISGGRLQGGLMYELMEQIAANAGAEAHYTVLPSKRVDAAMEQGEVDLHCLMSPVWFKQAVPAARWSVPVLRLDDWLTAKPGSPSTPLVLEAQQQTAVGLVLGYSYPHLEPFFRAGQLYRDDAPTQELLLEKLARGRTRYAVVNRLVIDDYNRGRAPSQRLVPLQMVQSFNTHCLLSARTGMAPGRILAAVRKLVDSGQLQTIQARYR